MTLEAKSRFFDSYICVSLIFCEGRQWEEKHGVSDGLGVMKLLIAKRVPFCDGRSNSNPGEMCNNPDTHLIFITLQEIDPFFSTTILAVWKRIELIKSFDSAKSRPSMHIYTNGKAFATTEPFQNPHALMGTIGDKYSRHRMPAKDLVAFLKLLDS